MRKLTERFDDALVFASEAHRKQVRKGGDIPYVSHLMAVSAMVLENGGDEDQAIAALLHDAAEDQGGRRMLEDIRVRFGDRVAGIVADCTDSWADTSIEKKEPWQERKDNYLEKLSSKSPDSLLVSLADKVHNARAIRDDYRELGDELWPRFAGCKKGTVWYYHELSKTFSKIMPGRLADELATIVAELNS